MPLVVIAKRKARKGEVGKVEEAVRQLAQLAREEPGNLFYQAHRDPEDKNLFAFYRQCTDESGYEVHVASEHFQKPGFGTTIPLLESREREFYTTLDL